MKTGTKKRAYRMSARAEAKQATRERRGLRDRVVFALSDRMWDRGLPAINAARAAHGLSPLAHTVEQMTDVDQVLVLSTRALDYPGVTPPAHVKMAGPRLEDPAWTDQLDLHSGDAPLVTVVQSAPHSEVLKHEALMVTHAGHVGRDQNENAARAAFAGAGVRLKPTARASKIAAAVRAVLDEPAYREAAERAAHTIAEEREQDVAVDALEAMAVTSA